MERKQFITTIQASPEKIWQVLWGKDTYPQWTRVFSEGSRAETDWQKGSRVLFLDNNGDGMIALIRDAVPNEYMSIEHQGEIIDGKEDTESAKVKEWAGAQENYRLTPNGNSTQLVVEMDMAPDFEKMFTEIMPKALALVKEIAEKQ
ncbi:hypothetical protein HNQ91_003701 [Filimonas zeae]|uniref:Activator of Hsp90 ATPase homologue 1/2-like C-terminal domain-containing protein n=1 Tax=Filimonas zeae TaxID=1737353 RepID=A0A917J0E2_9BACT|nr:SRPBCC domain-containing protein [Filimonas zeae]MDR6340636.1 hypothetical protein [Filimonas zeae]GGH73664.1 hypothetical protein GCM10011379_35420 [Filimonas zeae]